MVSRRERREQERKERKRQETKQRASQARKDLAMSIAKWSAAVLVLALAAWWLLGTDRGEEWPYGSVHWHANFDVTVCGEQRDFRNLGSESVHYGNQYLHTHGDNTYHLEGNPQFMERASLGAFFDAINIPFSNRGIYEYADGGACPDGSDAFTVEVNDNPVENPRSYVPRDGDSITIVFG